MDTDESGTLDKDEFLKIPQINSNPLAARLLAVFDTDGSGDIDFKEFLTGINVFSGKGTPEDKLKCNMYFKQLYSRYMIWIGMVIFLMVNYFWY